MIEEMHYLIKVSMNTCIFVKFHQFKVISDKYVKRKTPEFPEDGFY